MEKEYTVLLKEYEMNLLINVLEIMATLNKKVLENEEDQELIGRTFIINATQEILKEKLKNILIINE